MKSAIWCWKCETRPPLRQLLNPAHSLGLFKSPAHASGKIIKPRLPFAATKSREIEKKPKWPKNDQFRQFHFLNTRFFDSSYTPIDAKWEKKFFEITCRFLTGSVLEILTKNVQRNQSTKFCRPSGFFHWRLGIQQKLKFINNRRKYTVWRRI